MRLRSGLLGGPGRMWPSAQPHPSLLCAQPLLRRVVLSPVSLLSPVISTSQSRTSDPNRGGGPEAWDSMGLLPVPSQLSPQRPSQPGLTLLTLVHCRHDTGLCPWAPVLAWPFPTRTSQTLTEGLMEGEGGIVLIDPGLVIILLSPLSSPELLSPEQAHPRTGHQVHFLRKGAKVTCSHWGLSRVEAGVVINDRVEAPLSLSHVRSGK